jgi:hypothetical protein
MLTTFEVLLYAGAVLLLPLIVYSLITGSQPPENNWFAKYCRVEKYLNVTRDLFLLAVCATVIARLGLHFGYIDPSAKDRLALVVGIPFAVTLFEFLGLWIRAAPKARRLGKSSK